jgi:hypothetical protein
MRFLAVEGGVLQVPEGLVNAALHVTYRANCRPGIFIQGLWAGVLQPLAPLSRYARPAAVSA